MIRVYDKNELLFTSLGLGSLDEATSSIVSEELNGTYELELEYPLTGRHFDKLQIKNIIFCSPNMYSEPQPFRIYYINKPINGKVTVNASHISYDASGIVVMPRRNIETNEIMSFGELDVINNGYYLDSVLNDINASHVLPNEFKLHRGDDKENVLKENGYSIPNPMNLRSMLGGSEGSLLDQYQGEYEFNKFDIYLKNKRGSNRGITIRYGKNLTDLEQETEGVNLFTGIFPFYSKRYSESVTNTSPIFQPAYVIPDVTPLRADWLSIEFIDVNTILNGILPKALNPVVETVNLIVDDLGTLATYYVPIIVKTEGSDYEDKIYIFRKNTTGAGNLVDAYVSSLDESGDILTLKDLEGNQIVGVFGIIYVIKDAGTTFYNKKVIYDGGYSVYERDGFYVEVVDARTVEQEHPFTQYPIMITLDRISWSDAENKWVNDPNGQIYVRPIKPDVSTISVDKYIYLDLLNHDGVIEVGSSIIFDPITGILYINETSKNQEIQNILTLDMTDDLDNIDNVEPAGLTKSHLFEKAEEYLKNNDFTLVKETITVSFIQLSNSKEYERFKDLEVVQIGDEINIVYEKLGVNTTRRVIRTEYDAISNAYTEIELGDKASSITGSVITTGDNVSSLKNDADYANKKYIVDLIVENAKIVNAEIQNAIIKTLEVSKINVSGLLEASLASIDQLVAKMFSADNAAIANALVAGTVRVKGNITMDSGSITINKLPEQSYVSVYILENETFMSKYWLTLGTVKKKEWFYVESSVSQMVGDVNIDGSQYVTGQEEAKAFIDVSYPATEYSLNIVLVIKDSVGVYFKFNCLEGNSFISLDPSTYPVGTVFSIKTEGIYKDKNYRWNFDMETYFLISTYVFYVDEEGNVIANALTITGGSIQIGDNFYVSNEGILTAKGVKVIDGEISIKDKFKVDAAGNVTAKVIDVDDINAKSIDSDEIKVTDLVVNRLYLLEDKQVYIERVTENNVVSESQTVSASARAFGTQDNDLLYVNMTVTVSVPFLYYSKSFNVSITYRDNYGQVYTEDITISIGANSGNNGFGSLTIPVDGLLFYTVDRTAVVFPSGYTESIISGTVSTDKIVLHVGANTYDIVTGIVDQSDVIRFYAQETEPDTTDLENNSLWFDID